MSVLPLARWGMVTVVGGENDGIKVEARVGALGQPEVNVPALFIPHGVTHYELDTGAATLTLPEGYEQ